MSRISYYAEITSGGTDYIINGSELGRFNANKSLTNRTGQGRFPLADPTREYADTFNMYDEFKLYVDGVYGFGGHINQIDRSSGVLDLRVVSYTDMLKWAICQDDSFTSSSGSAMLNTASTGLIKKYYEDDANRKTIYSSTYVDSSAQDTFDMDFDNESVFDALKRIAQNARRSGGSVPYDFYVDYFPATDKIELYFDVKNNASSGVTLREGQDFQPTYRKILGDLDQVYNEIIVRAATRQYCPTDLDYWTDLANPETNGVWTDIDGDVDEDASIKKFGSYSVLFNPSAGEATTSFDLNLDDTDAYNSAVMDANMFSQGNGFIIDTDIQQYLEMWIYMNSDFYNLIEDDGWNFHLLLRDESSNNIGRAWEFTENVRVPEQFRSKWGRIVADLTSLVDDESYVGSLHFDYDQEVGSVTPAGTEQVNVDGLAFYNEKQIVTDATTDATSITNYGKRTGVFTDTRIPTLAAAIAYRDKLLAQYKDPNHKIHFPLINSVPITGSGAIELGETFVGFGNEIPSLTYRLREVVYTPSGQTLIGQLSTAYVDRDHNMGQFTGDIQRNVFEAQRR